MSSWQTHYSRDGKANGGFHELKTFEIPHSQKLSVSDNSLCVEITSWSFSIIAVDVIELVTTTSSNFE